MTQTYTYTHVQKQLNITARDIRQGDILLNAAYPQAAEVISIRRIDVWKIPNSFPDPEGGALVHLGLRPLAGLPDQGYLNIYYIARFTHESVMVWRKVRDDET